ncbi:hypothetical protein K438DRAFT_1778699 [Mycena galopus ATCC 62051]|nr:hypothetical protein K438DRAFT_1778699 [Mycena galopus ATCC 62051]
MDRNTELNSRKSLHGQPELVRMTLRKRRGDKTHDLFSLSSSTPSAPSRSPSSTSSPFLQAPSLLARLKTSPSRPPRLRRQAQVGLATNTWSLSYGGELTTVCLRLPFSRRWSLAFGREGGKFVKYIVFGGTKIWFKTSFPVTVVPQAGDMSVILQGVASRFFERVGRRRVQRSAQFFSARPAAVSSPDAMSMRTPMSWQPHGCQFRAAAELCVPGGDLAVLQRLRHKRHDRVSADH